VSALRIASRGSTLALAQAEAVASRLGGAEVVPVRSEDSRPGDKARFVRGVEQALLDGRAELGVHSAKDVPGERPDGIEIAAVPEREDPADGFVGEGASLAELPEGARIGTASLRRRAQLLAARPDLEVSELRGNVDTRLQRLADGDLDGIVLAAAGLRRLGRSGEIGFTFEPAEMTSAPGQGALLVDARAGHPAARDAARIGDRDATAELTAERAASAALGAGCDTPVGVLARAEDLRLVVHGFAGLPDGSEWVRDSLEGDGADPAALGRELGERMLAAGAAEILERSRGVRS
jgi:hydroxymethylbilane synthase